MQANILRKRYRDFSLYALVIDSSLLFTFKSCFFDRNHFSHMNMLRIRNKDNNLFIVPYLKSRAHERCFDFHKAKRKSVLGLIRRVTMRQILDPRSRKNVFIDTATSYDFLALPHCCGVTMSRKLYRKSRKLSRCCESCQDGAKAVTMVCRESCSEGAKVVAMTRQQTR